MFYLSKHFKINYVLKASHKMLFIEQASKIGQFVEPALELI